MGTCPVLAVLCRSHPALSAPILAVLLLLSPASGDGAEARYPGHPVLVLNSYHPGYAWSDGELHGLLRVLSREHPGIMPSVEFLDARRHPAPEHESLVLDFILAKHREQEFELIITIDDPALRFALAHRAKLGATTPIVFGGVNNFRPEILTGHTNVTGIAEAFDFAGNIELILDLRRQTKRIVLIGDRSESTTAIRRALDPLLPRYSDRVLFEDLVGWTAEALLEEVSALPPDTAGLVLGYPQDVTGIQVWENEEFLRSLATRSAVPLFMLTQPYLPVSHGSGWSDALWFGVGGSMLSSEAHGESVGDLAASVLRGVPVSALPVSMASQTRLAFDNSQLLRHGIDRRSLPPEAAVYGRDESFFERYRLHILITLGVVSGLCLVIAVLAVNIMRRVRAERSLVRSNERFHLVARATNDAVWDLDLASSATWWNGRFPEILGWPPETPPSREAWIEAIHPEDRAGVVEHLFSRDPARPNPLVLEHRFIRADGALGHAMLRAYALQDEHGQLRRLVGSMLDLTERQQKEDELRFRNQELERFTYTVSHDLKSPLITIRGFAGSMAGDLAEGRLERLPGDLERITIAADKMSDLLNDLLELSRVGRVMNPPVEIPLAEIVEETEGLLEVFQNLVANALKFTKPGEAPQVEIGARREGDVTVLYVADHGMGIARGDQETVFGLFNKLDPESEGTGIGLALVRRIVEVHGGRIWVESAGPGQGTAFCFTLAP